LYGCETWSLTLREKRRLRVLKNRVLRRVFGPKRDEVTGEWRKLHNEELNGLYCSPNIVRVHKWRRIRWVGHVERMADNRSLLRVILRCVIPVVLSNNQNKLNGTYVYRHKHNYIPCSTFTTTKVQLHVSAINVGHLQVVHEELINKLLMYQ